MKRVNEQSSHMRSVQFLFFFSSEKSTMGNDVEEGRIKCAKVNENYESKQMFEGRISLRSTKSCLANEPIIFILMVAIAYCIGKMNASSSEHICTYILLLSEGISTNVLTHLTTAITTFYLSDFGVCDTNKTNVK